ncbi:MAG: hypothetical protein WAQ27_01510 [Candidatus Microsaccharimonas sp.]
MSARVATFRQMVRRFSPQLRARARVLKKFSHKMGFVHFGLVDQHNDDYDPIRGFTASLTHIDADYAVGTYEGYNVRLVDRFDSYKHGSHAHEQLWCIIEVALHRNHTPHVFLTPTGREAGEYDKLFSVQPYLQPLNTMVFQNHSPELHGRYQILSRTTHSSDVERLLTSPIVVGIGSRFWPHGVEFHNGKLYIYITQHRLTKTVLETSLASSLWLAEMLDEIRED